MVRSLWASDHNILSTDWHINWFYVCLCLEKACLIYTIDSLTPNPRATHAYGSGLNEALPTHRFSLQGAPRPFCTWHTGWRFSTTLTYHCKQQDHQQKAQKYKSTALNIPWQGHLFTKCCFVQHQLGTWASGGSHFLPLCICLWMTEKAQPYWFEITDTF